ncbi:hypothetical protein Efla_003085 [Eimeria flavescens]
MAAKVDKMKKLEPVPKPDEKQYRDRIQAETTAIEELKAKIVRRALSARLIGTFSVLLSSISLRCSKLRAMSRLEFLHARRVAASSVATALFLPIGGFVLANELQQKISAVIGGREEYNMEKQNRQARLDALQKQIDELEDKRKVLFEKIQLKQKEGADLKQSATDLRRKIGFSSVEDIDQKVAALEHSMMTSTLSLKEEKALLEEIKRLKNSKPLLSKYQALEQSASSLEDTSVVPLRSMLDDVRTKLLELRTQKREESMKYKELLEKRQKATAPGREMIEERERLSKEMSKHFVNVSRLLLLCVSQMQKYQLYLQVVRLERGLKMREERERRNLENERFQLMRDLERVESELPYEAECLLLAQTMQYLRKITEEPNAVSEKEKENEDNMELAGALLPKSQRKEVFFFAPKQKGKHCKENDKKKERPKMLKYDVGTLAYFEQCGVTAPVTLDEVPACLEKLDAKLQNYKEMQNESSRKVRPGQRQICVHQLVRRRGKTHAAGRAVLPPVLHSPLLCGSALSHQVGERKAEIMTKVQAVDAKLAALAKKEKSLEEGKEDELADDTSPTADDADDE